jgi:hypothetical protein
LQLGYGREYSRLVSFWDMLMFDIITSSFI